MKNMRKMTIKKKKGTDRKDTKYPNKRRKKTVKGGKWRIGDPIAKPLPLSKCKPPHPPIISLSDYKTELRTSAIS